MCYNDDIEAIVGYCNGRSDLRLVDASNLIHQTWSNSSVHPIVSTGSLHACAIRALLVERSDWLSTFQTAWSSITDDKEVSLVLFGPERCVPPSQLRRISQRVTYMTDTFRAGEAGDRPVPRKDDDVAVVGMSIKVAGADDTNEFWELLCSGRSQHKEVPTDRVSFKSVWREADTTGRKWYGNFINDHDAFDHKFFKKPALEVASSDPQQRQMLQCAYQAVEQSGYFGSVATTDKNVGCFVGICNGDYENNMVCHRPNAFMATGNLKSFIAGKISHWFGWQGPSLVIDSACSSSLVAIHYACRALLSGDCSAALAGGANIMTGSPWFENLAAAGFLSPTGQCKPFDAQADGYCRGEGFAAVYLKKMSCAIADGDQILGTISATAVLQNQNCTPVFVPNSPSLVDLFQSVLNQARLSPQQITIAEAHGTGTPVGDPAEYVGLREVLGGSNRSSPLALGSAKGSVGHTESTSGAVSLLKTLLMIQRKMIPPQASFSTMNPAIPRTPLDNMEVVTKLKPWVVPSGHLHAALINNYGASGSNASMVVTEAPRTTRSNVPVHDVEYPLRIFGYDERALKAYSSRLRRFLSQSASTEKAVNSIANLAFNVSRQGNPTLDKSLIVSARSTDQFIQRLDAFASGDSSSSTTVLSASKKPARPIILCFGGQVNTFVGLNRDVYDAAKILRMHLDDCDKVCLSLPHVGSIFPSIFQCTPVADIVKLQTVLFAMQYASAKSWIDCGVKPAALIGHSFGELVALSISGVLSLHDALKMVAGRAALIRDSWTDDNGSMIAVEGDLDTVNKLLAESGGNVTIACYNGPRSFTLAGTTIEVDQIAQALKQAASSKMRSKRLNVTHAFHSTLVEPLVPRLVDIGKELVFHEPTIPLEMSTEYRMEDTTPQAKYVADHMRRPVYFSHAVDRLAHQYPSAVFLEGGSNSTITAMASRALGSPKTSHFQAVNITGNESNGLQLLINSTLSLWKEGLPGVTFWPHHRVQTYQYVPVILPPYQFEKSRHWMEMKAPPTAVILPEKDVAAGISDTPLDVFSFLGYKDKNKRSLRFRINTSTEKYKTLLSGHTIAKTAAICPATFIIDIAIEALTRLWSPPTNWQPEIHDVINQAPICIDESRTHLLEFDATDTASNVWDWRVVSSGSEVADVMHVSGQLLYVSMNDTRVQAGFKRYERLVGYHQHCVDVLTTSDPDDIIHGARNIYRAFSDVVDYSEPYRGLQRLVGKGNESAGRVVKRYSGETWLDTLLSDCFCQVGGIWVNCMTQECSPADMYIATGIEKWVRSPSFVKDYIRPETWDVLARHEKVSDKMYLTDIFVFDPKNGDLAEVILGIKYHRVSKVSIGKTIARLTPGLATAAALPTIKASVNNITAAREAADIIMPQQETLYVAETPQIGLEKATSKTHSIDVEGQIRVILAEISGLEPAEITMESRLAEIGIDSLMGMELGREMEGVFKTALMSDELAEVTTFRELVTQVATVLSRGDSADEDQTSEETVSGENSGGLSTPATAIGTAPSTSPPVEREYTKPASVPIEDHCKDEGGVKLSPCIIFEAFEESKRLTDDLIAEFHLVGYMDTVLPRQTQMCVALVIEAFEQLEWRLCDVKPGEVLQRIPHERQHERLMDRLYGLLEKEARLLNINPGTGVITRTAIAASYKSSEAILADLLEAYPEHAVENRLIYFAGRRLTDVLRGDIDGIKLIFGTDEGRELVTGLYGDLLLNKLANAQMREILKRLIHKISRWDGPLKIMELGAGTGGTTKEMVPMLASLGVPIEYTFTDLSGSFVAAARKKFGKDFPFMKFRIQDIEQPPAADMIGTQHIVIAHNAIHATRSLYRSVFNVRKALRPDGFLMILEMTQPVYWVDMIFGLFEGWWLFEDGRTHAIANQTRWQADLQRAGYGRVDWTDGWRPEVEFEHVIVAQASVQDGFPVQPTPMKFSPPERGQDVTTEDQKVEIDEFVRKYSQGFNIPISVVEKAKNIATASMGEDGACVIVTGGTGSLGSHLIEHLVSMPAIKTVICLNRRSTTAGPEDRQEAAFTSRGINIPPEAKGKIRVLATESAKIKLGLDDGKYQYLVENVTHIVHNAWPMSEKRPVSGFEVPFRVLRALLELSRDIAVYRSSTSRQAGFKINFQFISSIALMGHYSILTGNGRFAPEERATVDQLLPNGYAHAKWVCERMLDETLHRYPSLFRTTAVRPGQISGSLATGYWNEQEHLSFLIKSSQTLRMLPELEGDMCWTPVDIVAATLADLLFLDPKTSLYPIYHIDNPVRQPWSDVLRVLASELGVPRENIVPFRKWVNGVRSFPGTVQDNPAARLISFLDENFIRMSCGGMLLDTTKTCEHSPSLRNQGPVGERAIQQYLDWWKRKGFLHN